MYQKVSELEREGIHAALCTVVAASGSTPRGTGSKMLVFADGRFEGTIGGGEMESRVIEAALDSLSSGQPQLLSYQFSDPERGDPGVCGGQMEVYVEPVMPPEKVVVYGAGHVGRKVAELAHWLGLQVALLDDRAEMIDEVKGMDVASHLVVPGELARQAAIHARTAVLFTTRNVEVDAVSLPEVLKSEAAYIGVIGSRRRWQTAVKKMLKAGVDAAALARVVSPMGLEIEAETPEEIAVSILAEVIMALRGGDGSRMGMNADAAGLQSKK